MQILRPLTLQMIRQLIIWWKIDLITLNPCMYPKYWAVDGATKCKLTEHNCWLYESNKNFWKEMKIASLLSGCKPAFWIQTCVTGPSTYVMQQATTVTSS